MNQLVYTYGYEEVVTIATSWNPHLITLTTNVVVLTNWFEEPEFRGDPTGDCVHDEVETKRQEHECESPRGEAQHVDQTVEIECRPILTLVGGHPIRLEKEVPNQMGN